MAFEQKIGRSIKLIEPNILSEIVKVRATHVAYKHVDTDQGSYLSFSKSSELIKNSSAISGYKKEFLKLRTPAVLRQFAGCRIRAYHYMFSKIEGELFRIEPIDFDINGGAGEGIKNADPRFTKGGCIIIPKVYISTVMNEASFLNPRISFNETSSGVADLGYIYAYITNAFNPFSYPLYSEGVGLKSKPVGGFLDLISSIGKKYTTLNTMRPSI